MAQRRSPHRARVLSPSPVSRKKYPFRRFPTSRRRALAVVNRFNQPSSDSHASHASTSPSSEDGLRQVLVPLHPNLRRLPSRVLLAQKVSMRVVGQSHLEVQVGMKRKRVASSNENSVGGRSARDFGRSKRQKSASRSDSSSEEDGSSTMEIDRPNHWIASDDSDDGADDAEDSTDDHLINDAAPRQLLRLRKDELVRLYISSGLSEDADTLTKPEIVDAIIAARDDIAELPPSSPRGDGGSSEYSSDEGNVAGDEETDINVRLVPGNRLLRRRATINGLSRTGGRPINGRSLSLGNMHSGGPSSLESRKSSKTNGDVKEGSAGSMGRRRMHNIRRSSPSVLSTSSGLPSPPATRARSRKVSAETTSSTSRGKGKGKQVEFNDKVEIHSASRANAKLVVELGEDSDLTDLAELEEEMATTKVAAKSPRRLRSRGRRSKEKVEEEQAEMNEGDSESGRRITPMRRAKDKIGSLKEDDEDESVDEDVADGSEDEVEELQDIQEDDEVDELVSSPSPTPPLLGRRTPLKRRLRPRLVQTHTPPSDGDDEHEDSLVDDHENDECDESDMSDVEGGAEDVFVDKPRKLRNGKIVGEEDIEEDIEEGDEEDEFEEAEGLDGGEDIDVDVDVDADGELDESDEATDDVDLTVATAKTLVRLRRDDLVRLCETRDLDVAGTKPQLAEALLEWRDRQANDFSSPSSAGTARPPSTARPRRRRSQKSGSKTPPVLMRSGRFHMDEPRTPPISTDHNQPEPELELDLESLGLDDREIPAEKLTKLEKIGSGGFKDVFIGKFKGRKIAISEFRGQLSAMDIKELKLLGGFDHSNIVRFLGVSIPENTRETPVMIVSELCVNGDLFDYVRNVPPPSLHKVLSMMLDIARGLEYLHLRKPSVIHRDCKSSNILITSKGTAKIADFGLAKVKQSTRSMVRSLVGTVNWQAPELWHAHPKYNYKVDVFSCAMVYWEMLQWHLPNKKFPWEGMNEHAIYEIVGAKRQRPSINGLKKQWCSQIVDLMERMWAQEHQDRPTMTEVVEELEALISHR